MNLLLVEDDTEIREMLSTFLGSEGYNIECAEDGEEALKLFKAMSFNLVLLDLMIPKKNGMEVMKEIRKESIVPIIIISAKDSDSDKTLGLGLGADDYITKPFSVTDVLARIKANIRRTTIYSDSSKKETSEQSFRNITINTDTYTATKDGEKLSLTAKEFEILKLLMKNPDKVYTKAQIYNLVWKDPYLGDENAVNVHISRLRNKIEDDPKNPLIVLTVWGIGYKLGENNE